MPTRQGKSPASDDASASSLPRPNDRSIDGPGSYIPTKYTTVYSKGDGTMRRFLLIAVVAGLAVATTVLVADAQMPAKTQTDSTKITNPATDPGQGHMMGTYQGHMMGSNKGQMMDWSTMVGQMDNQQLMMSGQFDTLQTRFEQMMKINDLAQLKHEMKSYMQMMKRMHKSMMAQDHMAGQMMSMMNNGSMPHQHMMGSGQ
jgi:hypothetical protein